VFNVIINVKIVQLQLITVQNVIKGFYMKEIV